MNDSAFAALCRVLGTGSTRRLLLGILAPMPVVGDILPNADEVEANKGRQRKNRRKRRDRNDDLAAQKEKEKEGATYTISLHA